MSYRKFKADFLFDGFTLRETASVLICREDGTIEDIVSENEAGEAVETHAGMLSPGFVNCHCHLELSHMKGLVPEKKGLVDFVLAVVGLRNQSDPEKQAAMAAAANSMFESGIVAVGDICNNTDSIPAKSTRFPMESSRPQAKSSRLIAYYNFMEVLGWLPGLSKSRFEYAVNNAALFLAAGADEKHLSLSPHAPYSISDPLWELMKPGFRGKTITIHNQESAAENEFFQSGSGDLERMYSLMKMDSNHFTAPCSHSLPYILPKLKSASKVLLVHNTFTDENDLTAALSFSGNLYFCFCPSANKYIEDRLPDIPMFIRQNARVVLGTDSLASNHQLSILEEMKTIKQSFPGIPTSSLLLWACSNGAEALSFDDRLGDFKKGKKPGVVLIENLDHGEVCANSTSRSLL